VIGVGVRQRCLG